MKRKGEELKWDEFKIEDKILKKKMKIIIGGGKKGILG